MRGGPTGWAIAALAAVNCKVQAQEIEPRSYSPAPVGQNFLNLSMAQSSGGISVDPTLPVDDVEATINSATTGYMRTFALLGRTASAGIAVPYAWGDVSGNVLEERRTIRRSGLGDARMRFSVNLFGGPAVDRKEFAAQQRSTQFGASLMVAMPTGEYDSRYLINLGSNRWAAKVEVGMYQPFGPWALEVAAGMWHFADNNDFYGGTRRHQDPVASMQAHVSYTFRPRLWVAADYSYYRGGETTVDGVEKDDLQASSRVGLVMSLPLTQYQSVKLGWSDGVTTRIGADFSTYTVTWQRSW